MSARDEMLARIRAAVADGAAPAPVARDYRTASQPPAVAGEELLELLVERLVRSATQTTRPRPDP